MLTLTDGTFWHPSEIAWALCDPTNSLRNGPAGTPKMPRWKLCRLCRSRAI